MSCCSHATGSKPSPVVIAFSRPIWVSPSGRTSYTNRQIAAAATPLMAIGRKMIVFDRFSPRVFSLSASTATARPRATTMVGAMMIQSSVLIRVIWKSRSPSRSV